MIFRKSSFATIFLAAAIFLACEPVFKKTVVTHQEINSPKFTSNEADFQDAIFRIIPAEDVNLSSSVSQVNGGVKTHSLTVKILNRKEFSSPVDFFSQAGAVKDQAEQFIQNIDQYDKTYVLFEEKSIENGSERTRTQKREISL